MRILTCSPCFVGFLSAIYTLFKSNQQFDSIETEGGSANFLDEYTAVSDNVEHAVLVKNGIIKKGGALFYQEIADAFLSCNDKKCAVILDYLRLFFKHGLAVKQMFNHQTVLDFNNLVHKVTHESQQIFGFLRFIECASGAFYGFFTSDNDVLEKVMPLFATRFNDQTFCVHDVKRAKAGVHADGKVEFIKLDKITVLASDSQAAFAQLWRQYHQSINIKERANPKLQNAFAPKRYRHFMSEF